MQGDASGCELSKESESAETTRRVLLVNLLGVGVSGLLTEGAEARSFRRWRLYRVSHLTAPDQVFLQAEKYFNKRDWNNLYGLLASGVICYTVQVGSPISGRDNVITALRQIGNAGATFKHLGPPSVSPGSGYDAVTGCARWHDWDGGKGSGHPPDIDYLTYEFRVVDGQLTYMWAPEGPCGPSASSLI